MLVVLSSGDSLLNAAIMTRRQHRADVYEQLMRDHLNQCYARVIRYCNSMLVII